MKRVISLLLCLVMCISVFSSTAVQVAALGTADKIFTVKSGIVTDGKITYIVSLSGGTEGFGGSVVLVEYDNTVLQPVEFLPATTGSGAQRFNGIYVDGFSAEYDNVYSIAYTNTTPEKVSANTEFFKLTFEVVNDERPTTSVNFYCKEFFSTTDSEQSITVEDGLQTIAKIDDVSTLESPKLVGATLYTDGVTFQWEETVGATQYEIRRKTPIDAWTIVATVTADNLFYNDVNLESGNTYIYSVKAINAYGMSMFDSNGVSCKYISKPSNVVAVNGVDGVDITWDKTNGADSYKIMRRELGETEWSVVSERSAALSATFKDTTVENGKTYEYDVNSTLGSFTTDTLEEGKIVTYLPSPSVNSVTNISEGIELKWGTVENAAYYTIYRRIVGVETELTEYATVVSNSFIDSEVAVGKAYTYSIKAVNDYGESAFTKTGYTITRVPSTYVTGLVAQADSVTVTWDAVDGVDGYYIYRKTEDSSWEKAGSVPKTATNFEDKGAESGKTYFYCSVPYIGNSESEKVCSEMSVYYLKAPQNVTAVNTNDAIKVSWSASAGTNEYRVFRQDGLTTGIRLIATVDAGVTEYLDTDVENGAFYSYYIQAASTKGESKYSDITPDTMKIDCVEKIKAEMQAKGIMISWKEHPFADSYIVCRRSGDKWTRIAQTKSFEYIDGTVVSGEVYAYSVIPVVGSYEGGINDDEVCSIKYIAQPTVSSTTNYKVTVVVEWTSVKGAQKYLLQRVSVDSKGQNSGSYKTIATVSAPNVSYKDTNVTAGQTYRYRVYAVIGDEKSVVSAAFTNTFLAIPKISSLSNAYGGIKVSWGKVKSAEKYNIMRKESGGSWKTIKTVSSSTTSYTDKTAKNGVKYDYAVRATAGSSVSNYESKSFTYFGSPKVTLENRTSAITVTWAKISGAKSYYVYRKGPGDKSWKKVSTVTKNIYTDKNVKNGKIYKYTVKAYNGKILSGYNTSGWTIKRLSAPKLKSVTNYASGITIKWGKVTGASKYIVMRKVSGSSKWEELKTTKSLSFTDKTAKAGKIYVYTVKAGYGDYRSIYIADGLKIKRLSRPSLVSVKSAKSGVTFKWKEVTGASGYYVYRKTGSGSWEQIAKVSGKTKTSYLDKTAKKGKTYYYSVRAYSGSYKSYYNKTGLKIKDKY